MERKFWEKEIFPAGMDEAGRGPLAGPVVAACVILPPAPLIESVNDSKKVSERRREILAPIIRETALAVGIGWVDEREIDRRNILEATKTAFARAYEAMDSPCAHVLVDAMSGLAIPAEQHALIHGDALSYLIAAASIVAKVERDGYMRRMDEAYPHYGFAKTRAMVQRSTLQPSGSMVLARCTGAASSKTSSEAAHEPAGARRAGRSAGFALYAGARLCFACKKLSGFALRD